MKLLEALKEFFRKDKQLRKSEAYLEELEIRIKKGTVYNLIEEDVIKKYLDNLGDEINSWQKSDNAFEDAILLEKYKKVVKTLKNYQEQMKKYQKLTIFIYKEDE